MTKLSIISILTRLAGLSVLTSDATFGQTVNQIVGPSGTKILAIVGVVAGLAGEILHLIDTQPSIQQPPPITPASHTD